LQLKPRDALRLAILKALVERLTGETIETVDAKGVADPKKAEAEAAASPPAPEGAEAESGWSLSYDYHETRYEAESTRFSTRGVVQTADGREITIDLDLHMSREFLSHRSISVRGGEALKDPLVINFSGSAAQLEERDFQFDLDLDGNADTIAQLRPGSGFLALDRDENGQIDDGGELFGPRTGEGFTELAQYDEDGNGWIDEADSIFQKLRIWSWGEDGSASLGTLEEHDVGAISLTAIDTPFSLKTDDNRLLGMVRNSGLYLGETGGAGSVQQLDLVV